LHKNWSWWNIQKEDTDKDVGLKTLVVNGGLTILVVLCFWGVILLIGGN